MVAAHTFIVSAYQASGMRVYRCEDCGAKMEYQGQTKRGKKYKCTNCGHTGYIKGMTESTDSGIDLGTYGL